MTRMRAESLAAQWNRKPMIKGRTYAAVMNKTGDWYVGAYEGGVMVGECHP